jgi:hypothetical protein
MNNDSSESKGRLDEAQIRRFIKDGFIKVNNAFSKDLAEECRQILWKDTGANPHDPATWKHPVVRLGDYAQAPFVEAANTTILRNAFDQLVGQGRWLPINSVGSFPIRFPSTDDPADDGWHVDASFPAEDSSCFLSYRINVTSKGRALLMLFLFSDVSENDAPTRIRVGSHLDVAKILGPAAEEGMTFMELAEKLHATANRPVTYATGKAGTVYLCHPFLVHAAQKHRGTNPKFMAQPPLHPAKPFLLHRDENDYSPVEIAIRVALGLQTSLG